MHISASTQVPIGFENQLLRRSTKAPSLVMDKALGSLPWEQP